MQVRYSWGALMINQFEGKENAFCGPFSSPAAALPVGLNVSLGAFAAGNMTAGGNVTHMNADPLCPVFGAPDANYNWVTVLQHYRLKDCARRLRPSCSPPSEVSSELLRAA